MTARFEGEVRAEWLTHDGDDRRMRLLEPFAFVDRRGVRWEAEAGDEIDGASIPDVLWSRWVGTPYIGDYRRATVLHDVHCDKQVHPHKDVHRMFYEACLCRGVHPSKAALMYWAVLHFGPSWPLAPGTPPAAGGAAAR